jgi:hypothetical protein
MCPASVFCIEGRTMINIILIKLVLNIPGPRTNKKIACNDVPGSFKVRNPLSNRMSARITSAPVAIKFPYNLIDARVKAEIIKEYIICYPVFNSVYILLT